MLYGSAGDADTADGASRATVATTRKNLLIKAFRGTLNPAITMKKFWPIDIVLDANYDVSVKNAINDLTLNREDFMFLCDTGFCATPEQAIEKRNGSLLYNNRYTAIFTQDMRVYDEYSSKNIKVTPTYFLAKKIPSVDRAYGIHYAFVGPNRGEVEGMVEGTLSWNPTEAQKEKLYKKQLNYIQHDPNHLMFMGQLTSQKKSTSLSDIPNVRALLMIRRNIEAICEEYYFERINENLLAAMSNACNTYLGQWVANGTLSKGNVSVYASEYDMKQKLVRVQVELTFTSFLERVVITFTVK
jgi:phage tail sheath protein FI